MCRKSYVDFVDSGWTEPKIWVLENNVDYVAPKAQKLIFDNMCEKSYVDFVDSGWTKPEIWSLRNNVDFVDLGWPKPKNSFSTICVENHTLIL